MADEKKKTILGDWGYCFPDPSRRWRTLRCWIPADQKEIKGIPLGATESGEGEWRLESIQGNSLAQVWVSASDATVKARTANGVEDVWLPSSPVEFEGPSKDGRGEWLDGIMARDPGNPRAGLCRTRVFRAYSAEDLEASRPGMITGAEVLRRLGDGRSYSWLKSAAMRGTIGHSRSDGRDWYDERDVNDLAMGRDPSIRRAAEEREYEAQMRSAWGEILPGSGLSGPETPRDAARATDPVDAFVRKHIKGDNR